MLNPVIILNGIQLLLSILTFGLISKCVFTFRRDLKLLSAVTFFNIFGSLFAFMRTYYEDETYKNYNTIFSAIAISFLIIASIIYYRKIIPQNIITKKVIPAVYV